MRQSLPAMRPDCCTARWDRPCTTRKPRCQGSSICHQPHEGATVVLTRACPLGSVCMMPVHSTVLLNAEGTSRLAGAAAPEVLASADAPGTTTTTQLTQSCKMRGVALLKRDFVAAQCAEWSVSGNLMEPDRRLCPDRVSPYECSMCICMYRLQCMDSGNQHVHGRRPRSYTARRCIHSAATHTPAA